MNARTICEYLDQIRWGYMPVDDATVLTGYPCIVPFYDFRVPIEIKITGHWVTIRALLQQAITVDRLASIAAFLSTMNAQCRVVRYFVINDCAVLQAEVPLSRFHPGTFLEALKNVCRYASTTGLEVSVLATNRSVLDLYKDATAHLARNVGGGIADDDPALQFDISANRLAD